LLIDAVVRVMQRPLVAKFPRTLRESAINLFSFSA